MPNNFLSKLHSHIQHSMPKRSVEELASVAQPQATKSYPRFPRIPLQVGTINTPVSDAFRGRRSYTGGGGAPILSLGDVSALCDGLRNVDETLYHRPYPSGGGLRPIETYILGAVDESGARVFHYDAATHTLEDLWPLPPNLKLSSLVPGMSPSTGEPTALVVFTSVWSRSARKYGDFTYLLALLEAGHAAQNVLLSAASKNIGARPVAGIANEALSSTLDIDPTLEQPIYSVACWKTGTVDA